MVSDGAMAMMCCTTWAGVLPDISARGHRDLEPYCIPICIRGFPFVQLHSPVHTYSCGLYGCTTDHTCKVSCVWQLL